MDGSREIQTHITTACLHRRQESCMERVNIVPTTAPFLHTPFTIDPDSFIASKRAFTAH